MELRPSSRAMGCFLPQLSTPWPPWLASDARSSYSPSVHVEPRPAYSPHRGSRPLHLVDSPRALSYYWRAGLALGRPSAIPRASKAPRVASQPLDIRPSPQSSARGAARLAQEGFGGQGAVTGPPRAAASAVRLALVLARLAGKGGGYRTRSVQFLPYVRNTRRRTRRLVSPWRCYENCERPLPGPLRSAGVRSCQLRCCPPLRFVRPPCTPLGEAPARQWAGRRAWRVAGRRKGGGGGGRRRQGRDKVRFKRQWRGWDRHQRAGLDGAQTN